MTAQQGDEHERYPKAQQGRAHAEAHVPRAEGVGADGDSLRGPNTVLRRDGAAGRERHLFREVAIDVAVIRVRDNFKVQGSGLKA